MGRRSRVLLASSIHAFSRKCFSCVDGFSRRGGKKELKPFFGSSKRFVVYSEK